MCARVQPAAPTLAQRILAHLRAYPVDENAPSVPNEVTQEGIAERLGVRVAHVSRALKHLMAAGLVKAHLAHPAGARRRSRAHALTARGHEAARGVTALADQAAARKEAPPRSLSATRCPAGRERELARMLALLDEAAKGALRVALLEGDSGAGKTRLLRAFAASARARGARVLEAPSVPVGGHQLLGPLGAALGGTSFDARLKARAAGTDRERAMLAAVDALTDAARAGTVALLLDDIQHAGPSSVEFLHGLLLALPADARVLCVVSFRREEAWELPNGPLYTALFPLRSLPGARHLLLPPLDAEGVAGLLADAGMTHVSGEVLSRLVRESGGNPLYALAMGEALADGVDERDFFPPAVQALAKERFMTLEPDALALLQTMAVAGAESTYATLLASWDGTEPALVRALDIVLDRLLLDEAPGESEDDLVLRFEHPKVREAVLADMTASRRRWLEARLAGQRG